LFVQTIFVLVCAFDMERFLKTCLGKIVNFYKVFGDFSEVLWKKNIWDTSDYKCVLLVGRNILDRNVMNEDTLSHVMKNNYY